MEYLKPSSLVALLETLKLTGAPNPCYRMLGSPFEAENAVQDTLLRAWRSLERFEGHASLRSWLYRIATNVCLDMLASKERRARPMDLGGARSPDGPIGEILPETTWIEPVPDGLVAPEDDPSAVAESRETIRLAFVAALQHLPPRQRAVLILCEVLHWRASEVAELLARYVDAFQRYDMDALTALIHEDATQSMPPYELWLSGRESILGWWVGQGAGCRGSRVIPTVTANGSPAFGQYKPSETGSGYDPWALQVLKIADGQIVEFTFFLAAETIFSFTLRRPPRWSPIGGACAHNADSLEQVPGGGGIAPLLAQLAGAESGTIPRARELFGRWLEQVVGFPPARAT